MATGQGEDFLQVLDLHQVVDGQQPLQPGQQGRGRRLDPMLHLPPGQPHQDDAELRGGRRLVSRRRCQTVRQAMLATHSRRRNAAPVSCCHPSAFMPADLSNL